MHDEPLTYAGAGVSLEAADAAVDALRGHVERTRTDGPDGAFGGFGALFALDTTRWRRPLLVTSCDGVGTKLEVARQLGRFDTVGRDLVAMVVDDIVVSGAEPLLLCDYLAIGRLDVAMVERIVAGIADGCVEAGCALVGGETAEHPGVLGADQFDVAGFGVGVVERDALLGPHRVRGGDALVAMESTGLHSNGYSLARTALRTLDLRQPHGLDAPSLGDVLLRPTRIYAPDCLALAATVEVHALCHVTGGGIPGNLPRVLPDGLGAVVDTTTFSPAPIFDLIARRGPVAPDEMWRTFNMGVGMIAIVPDGAAAVAALSDRDVRAWVCGHVTDEHPHVRLQGV